MFYRGQVVSTKYGIGIVLLVARLRPNVYVKVASRPFGIYELPVSDVVAVEVKPPREMNYES